MKRGQNMEIVGDEMFVRQGGNHRIEVIEHLMKPVMPLIAARVRTILTAAAKMFPDKCPHCGGAIEPSAAPPDRSAREGEGT